jgi:hypothetical protein
MKGSGGREVGEDNARWPGWSRSYFLAEPVGGEGPLNVVRIPNNVVMF